ncbi:MAG: tetratricopeptide repeat protein [Longimicrobiales bacterium]
MLNRLVLLVTALIVGALACSDGAEQARALEDRCGSEDMAACLELGIQFVRGHQVLSDWRRASALFEEACDGGMPEACTRLAWMHLHLRARDRGVRPDSAAATELYERACDDGFANGCVGLAELYLQKDSIVEDVEPTGPLQDLAHAVQLLNQACDAGEMMGCVRLGLLHRDSVGVEADPVRATELFGRACDDGQQLGCAHFGHSLEIGFGAPEDVSRASALYEASCETDDTTGCFFLGGLHERGVHLAQDYDRALDLYEDACYGNVERDSGSPGVAESCFRAAELYVTGTAGEGRRYRSIDFYRRACRMGYLEACEREG